MTSRLHHYNSGGFTCITSSGLFFLLKTVGNCSIYQERERKGELLHLELRMNPSLRFHFHRYGQEKGLQTWNLQMFKVGSSYCRAELSCNVSHFVTELQNPSCSLRASTAMSAQAAVWPLCWRLIATAAKKKKKLDQLWGNDCKPALRSQTPTSSSCVYEQEGITEGSVSGWGPGWRSSPLKLCRSRGKRPVGCLCILLLGSRERGRDV